MYCYPIGLVVLARASVVRKVKDLSSYMSVATIIDLPSNLLYRLSGFKRKLSLPKGMSLNKPSTELIDDQFSLNIIKFFISIKKK
jgi:hypothetical protein